MVLKKLNMLGMMMRKNKKLTIWIVMIQKIQMKNQMKMILKKRRKKKKVRKIVIMMNKPQKQLIHNIMKIKYSKLKININQVFNLKYI